jgi:LysR family glycine cleavage system transcriptional activator
VDAAVAGFKNRTAGSSIRISVQPFFASEYFIPRLSEFTEAHPEIDIQVNASDESSEKHPATADLSIRLFRSPPDDLESNLLFPLRLVPAGSPEFKENIVVRKKAIVSEFPLIVHETYSKAWSQWSKSTGIKLPDGAKKTRLDSMIAVVRAAQRGIGAALVPVPIGDLWFAEGSIVRLFKQELVTDSSYYLVWKKSRAEDKGLQLFRDWILRKFADPD